MRRVKQCMICDKWFHRDVASGQLIESLAKRKFNGEQYPQQFNRPDRPPVPPAAAPPANPMDLAPTPDAPPAISQVQVNQEEESPQNEADPDFDQGNQAHQVPNQTLCRKRKLKSIDNQFSKTPSCFIVSRGNLDQQYACLKKVPIYHTNSSFFYARVVVLVDNQRVVSELCDNRITISSRHT